MDPKNFIKYCDTFRSLIVTVKEKLVSMGEEENSARITALGIFLTNSIIVYQITFPDEDKEHFMDYISQLYDEIDKFRR